MFANAAIVIAEGHTVHGENTTSARRCQKFRYLAMKTEVKGASRLEHLVAFDLKFLKEIMPNLNVDVTAERLNSSYEIVQRQVNGFS